MYSWFRIRMGWMVRHLLRFLCKMFMLVGLNNKRKNSRWRFRFTDKWRRWIKMWIGIWTFKWWMVYWISCDLNMWFNFYMLLEKTWSKIELKKIRGRITKIKSVIATLISLKSITRTGNIKSELTLIIYHDAAYDG